MKGEIKLDNSSIKAAFARMWQHILLKFESIRTEFDNKLSGKANVSHGNHVPTTGTANNATFLRNDNVWRTVTPENIGAATSGHTHSNATTSAAGLMSATDKSKLDGIASGANAYTHPSYTARTGKPTANQTPAFGGTATVSRITSDATGHVTATTDRTITIPSTLSNGTGTAGLIKTTSTVTSNSGYTACPVISGVPYYKDTNNTYNLGSFGITATATELNYTDGVTSNIQTQLNGKAASSHNHDAGNITSGTLSSDRLPTVPVSKGGTGATNAATACTNLGIKDYVVEQAWSGNTYYRKWNSGIMEQWYQVNTTGQAINSAYGSMYIGSHKWTFPVAFTAVETVLCSYFRWGTSASWGAVVGATSTYADLRGYDLYSRGTNDTCAIAAYAMGKWK